MKITKYNDNWKVWEVKDSFVLNWDPPSDAEVVDLPHDAMILKPQDPDVPAGANSGYRKGGTYSYSKQLYAESPDKTYMLKIEGAYMNAFVYVNGQVVGKRPYGYTVFYVGLNEYLEYGCENEIRVTVRSGAEPSSRWYPGTGLYRDVYLLEAGLTYIKPDSVKIKTEAVEGKDAVVKIQAEVCHTAADRDGSCTIAAIILDPDGNAAADAELKREGTEKDIYCAELKIDDAMLWDTDSPQLYACSIELRDCSGNVIDVHKDSFGIRTMSLSSREGLKVNGKEVKLRGACIHHDSGILGAKTYDEAMFRQIHKLKAAGFNAIRSAHNPAAPALLRACDIVGMYVMDEAFDMWTRHKSDYDYAMYFDEWWEKDIEAMVSDAYNHPSIIMYSIGNEIPEISSRSGNKTCRKLYDKVRSLDDSRYVTVSVNGIFSIGNKLGQVIGEVAAELASQGSAEGNVNNFMAFLDTHMPEICRHDTIDKAISPVFEIVDIAGYNYMGGRYELDSHLYPDRVILGSETGISSVHTDWDMVEKLPCVIGDFCWTGWDYLGEGGIGFARYDSAAGNFGSGFPMQTGCTGDMDITGFRMPMSYYREIIFGLRQDPYIAVCDPEHYGQTLSRNPWIISDAIQGWTWRNHTGKPVSVEVYFRGDEVELYKNGVSLGRRKSDAGNKYMAHFDTTYEPGTLTAVSYVNGKETGKWEIKSADINGSSQLVISEEDRYMDKYLKEDCELYENADRIRFFNIELQDQMGNVICDSDELLNVEIEGNAKILAFGSGNPNPKLNYTEGRAYTYRGRAQLIVMEGKEKETCKINISAASGISCSITA